MHWYDHEPCSTHIWEFGISQFIFCKHILKKNRRLLIDLPAAISLVYQTSDGFWTAFEISKLFQRYRPMSSKYGYSFSVYECATYIQILRTGFWVKQTKSSTTLARRSTKRCISYRNRKGNWKREYILLLLARSPTTVDDLKHFFLYRFCLIRFYIFFHFHHPRPNILFFVIRSTFSWVFGI